MKWPVIEDTLRDWFRYETGLSDVIWQGEAVAYPRRPYGELLISSIQNVGTDEVREEYDATQPAGKEIVRTITGQRLMTLECTVRSRDNRAGTKALAYVEKARTSLAKSRVQAMFSNAEISFVEATPTATTHIEFDNRLESQATMDVVLCAVVNETDPRERGGFIEVVEVGTAITGGGNAADTWLENQAIVAGNTDVTNTLVVDLKGRLVVDENGNLVEADE